MRLREGEREREGRLAGELLVGVGCVERNESETESQREPAKAELVSGLEAILGGIFNNLSGRRMFWPLVES